MSSCFHVYSFLARNHGGIPFSGVCPFFYPDANSVLSRAHLCTAVDSMGRKPCVRNFSREREGLYNGNVRRILYVQHPVSLRIFPSLPGSRLRFSSPGKLSTIQCTVFDTLQPKLMHPAD